ncbi:tyrosine-protein kinase transmembrane receptor Ror-like isoform X2 [Apostichopus japonicus]|uniref:tyrosine-protein kinase transmembrane receptor Ror-like isoform X2 n=1 Tax=Stichopus japonicus TaxID=307972 RepID=UPI003AB6D227
MGITDYDRLLWRINSTSGFESISGVHQPSATLNVNQTNNYMYTTYSTRYIPVGRKDNIVCAVKDKLFSTTTSISRILKIVEPKQKPNASITYIYLLLAVVVILSCCVAALWKINATRRCKNFTRYKASSTESHPTHLAMATRSLPPLQSNSIESVMLEENIPGISDQRDEKENNYLSAGDVKLDFQLPSNGPMTYWKATVTCSKLSVTDVIAKSVSECARMRDLFNFRAIAKAIMTLPKHDNIVELIGTSLEDVPYFIYQEYIERGTLKDYMLRQCKTTTNDDSLELEVPDQEKNLQLTQFAVDICEGMFFLAQQNFRHPGLSARKVLLTPAGKCKLYDFCPVDVAVDSINQILQKKIPPTAWLAPETIFIGHYVEKSDVWSFGVVLWEIYSQGEIPYGGLTCAEIESKLRQKQYCEQPLTCPGGIFSTMLSIWNPLVDERPSFRTLRSTLHAFLNDMTKPNDDNDDEDIAADEPRYASLEKDSLGGDYIEHIM